MKTTLKIVAAAVASLAAAVPAVAQQGLPADFQRTMDAAVRGGARQFATMAVRANTRVPGLGPVAAGSWRPVTQATMQAGTDYPKIRGYAYAVEATVDYDGDGAPDVARLVDNGREGGVLVTFGDPRRKPMLVFRSDHRFGNGEGLFAAGRRLVVNIPEARQHVLYLQGSVPSVFTIGE